MTEELRPMTEIEKEISDDFNAYMEAEDIKEHEMAIGRASVEDAKEELGIKEEPIDFLQYYVQPHKVKSSTVESKDLDTVIKDSHILYNLCFTVTGRYAGGFAVAHPQINDKDPLCFFVTALKEVVINPKMIRHTQVTVDRQEGCLTYPLMPMTEVKRYNKCEVEYSLLTEDGQIGPRVKENLSGKRAEMFQHELDHFDAKYIYDNMESTNQEEV